MSNDLSTYIDDVSIPVSEFTTYYVYLAEGGGLPEEVNGVSKVVFAPHHVLLFDERGILICGYRASDVTNLEQSVAA